MLPHPDIAIAMLTERIILYERQAQECEDGDLDITWLSLGPFWAMMEVMTCCDVAQAMDYQAQYEPRYKFIFRKNNEIYSRLDRVTRLQWKSKDFSIAHLHLFKTHWITGLAVQAKEY